MAWVRSTLFYSAIGILVFIVAGHCPHSSGVRRVKACPNKLGFNISPSNVPSDQEHQTGLFTAYNLDVILLSLWAPSNVRDKECPFTRCILYKGWLKNWTSWIPYFFRFLTSCIPSSFLNFLNIFQLSPRLGKFSLLMWAISYKSQSSSLTLIWRSSHHPLLFSRSQLVSKFHPL